MRERQSVIRCNLKPALLTLATLTLAACASSPPTHFFTLDAVAPGGPSSEARAPTPLKIDAVHIPPALDRTSMVRGLTGNQLEISSQDRWAGDLGETIRRVLSEDLASRLPPGAVIAPDAPPPANARGIVVDILFFQPRGAGQVLLDADWTMLEGSQSHPVLSRSEHLEVTAAATAQGEAAAMSKLLGDLAGKMVAAIGTAGSGGG
jgi:uncharacterized lipoprotein YmbA